MSTLPLQHATIGDLGGDPRGWVVTTTSRKLEVHWTSEFCKERKDGPLSFAVFFKEKPSKQTRTTNTPRFVAPPRFVALDLKCKASGSTVWWQTLWKPVRTIEQTTNKHGAFWYRRLGTSQHGASLPMVPGRISKRHTFLGGLLWVLNRESGKGTKAHQEKYPPVLLPVSLEHAERTTMNLEELNMLLVHDLVRQTTM